MNPVVATPIIEKDAFFEDSCPPGAFHFNSDSQIWLMCPCGCEQRMCLAIYREGATDVQHPAWEFNGNHYKPTLAPSIRDLGGCRFHGYLTDGLWTFCADSGVKA